MKTWFVFLLMTAVAAGPPAAASDSGGLVVGDSLDTVLAVLGQPQGRLRKGDTEILLYDRGNVDVRNGVVVAHSVVSEAEHTRREEEAARKRETQRAAEAAERARIHEEGVLLRDARLADPDFAALPPEERVRVWREFRKQYPSVLLPAEYQAALTALEAELNRQSQTAEQERKIAELEQRVRDAEYAAGQAQAAAAEAEPDPIYGGYVYPYYPCYHSPPCSDRPCSTSGGVKYYANPSAVSGVGYTSPYSYGNPAQFYSNRHPSPKPKPR